NFHVTGVQTCALPICRRTSVLQPGCGASAVPGAVGKHDIIPRRGDAGSGPATAFATAVPGPPRCAGGGGRLRATPAAAPTPGRSPAPSPRAAAARTRGPAATPPRPGTAGTRGPTSPAAPAAGPAARPVRAPAPSP